MSDPLPPLPAPPGFGRVVPVDREAHAGLSLPVPIDYAWARKLNAVQLYAEEIAKAALSHPIAFIRAGGVRDGGFVPVAVLGLRDGESLAVDDRGRWQPPEAYIPAYIRAHPFCAVRVRMGDGEVKGVICVEDGALVPGAPALFGPDGTPGDAWKPVQDLFDAAEAAGPRTEAFTHRLHELGLMEPFEALVLPRGGEQLKLQGLWRVDETRLGTLPASTLRGLLNNGELRAIHAHLLSLEHLARLMARPILAAARAAG